MARRTANTSTLRSRLQQRAECIHKKIPILRLLPYASLRIILLVAGANVLIWAIAAVVLRVYPHLSSSAVLAYTLGLRHALDADHISAIDLTTRRLLATGRTDGNGIVRPVVTVGMWFSLGHSTIVIITTILVAATTAAVASHFDIFSSIGGIIGSSVSTAFLLVLGAINAWLLRKGIQNLRRIVREERALRTSVDLTQIEGGAEVSQSNPPSDDKDTVPHPSAALSEPANPEQHRDLKTTTQDITAAEQRDELTLRNRSCLNTLLSWFLRLIDRPWKIYPLGILFGLGFDTSSEIALLGITTLESSRSATNDGINGNNTNSGTLSASAVWAILIFPLLFTAGMCLLDTADGALMYALYTSRASGNSQLAMAYANVVLTGFTVLVAFGVGVLQFLNMLSNVLPEWRMDEHPGFWDGVAAVGDRYDIVGGVVCAGFIVVAVAAWLGYGLWKRKIVDRETL